MPLLRDRLDETKLKSLPFGNDRPDGGSSNQPYIQNSIDINLGVQQGTVAYNALGNDFLLRGGVLGAVAASANDVQRLVKFFNPFAKGASLNGALFVAKQAILERQNVDVVDGRSRIYLPTSTIAQAGFNAFGLHLDKNGINPFKAGYYGSGNTGYFPITKENDTTDFGDGSHNRLQLLYQVKRAGNDSFEKTSTKKRFSLSQLGETPAGLALSAVAALGATLALSSLLTKGKGLGVGLSLLGLGVGAALTGKFGVNAFKNKTTKIKLAADLYGITDPEDDTFLIKYGGGPGSTLGIGKTTLKVWNPLRFQNIEIDSGTTITKNEKYFDNADLYLTPTDGNIVTTIPILRETKFNSSKTTFARKRNGQDKIINPNLSVSSDQIIPAEDGDIIKFHFELINNDDTTKNTKIPLRAYIDDFSDTFNGEWDAYKYMGRAESFYRYKGFTRDFSLNFTVPTLSRTDLITNYQKLNALSWLTMPDYSKSGYIRGNLAFFTMGDYFNKAVIVMKSISFTPIMEMGFDINRNTDENFSLFKVGDPLYTGQLPKGIKVQCSMTPLTQYTNVSSEDDKTELFYTPQRGEALIGNRVHAIKDRLDTISKQYTGEEFLKDDKGKITTNKATSVYNADNPEQSAIFKETT
jgi:hypothetical protein